MAIELQTLCAYADELMQVERYEDYCPNGLQVEGRAEITRIASGVTASQALLDEALAWGADAILVHHGYFWKGEAQPVVGIKRARLAALLAADASLIAYHLPLDDHPQLGNNARFGELLGIAVEAQQPLPQAQVGAMGCLAAATTCASLVDRIAALTARQPLLIGNPQATVHSVAWCTGAAQGYIDAAVAASVDLYITGEVSEQTVHVARESGMQFIAAGHHATERYGVQALGEALAVHFGLEHRFFDVHNPV